MSRFSTRFIVVCAAFAAFFVGASCKLPKKAAAGDKCDKEGDVRCDGAQAALLCRSSALVTLPCRGPKGCDSSPDPDACDDNLANVGDNCVEPAAPNQNFSCSVDLKTMVLCKGGKFVAMDSCRGEKGCVSTTSTATEGGITTTETDIHCDDSLMQVGDACAKPDKHACSSDHAFWLVCKGSAMQAVSSCRGPKGCAVTRGEAHAYTTTCDDSLAQEGDVCEPEDEPTCSMDGKSLLHCSKAKYVVKKACHKGCKTKDDKVECD